MKTIVHLLVFLVVAARAAKGRHPGYRSPAALLTGVRYPKYKDPGSRYPDSTYQPCPFGCRCTSTLSPQLRWQRLLTSYRSRKMMSQGPFSSTAGRGSTVLGAHMTCMGLQTMPDYIPTDVIKVSFYGETNVAPRQQKDVAIGSAFFRLNDVTNPPRSYYQLTSIRKYSFSRHRNLVDLTIEGNRIKVIHPGDLEHLTNLKRLRLRNNRIHTMSASSLKSLTNLVEIDLSRNHIRRLAKSTFYNMTRLRKVLLNHNRLRSLHTKLFLNLKYMEILDLSDNLLQDLRKDVFYRNSKLREIHVSNNDVRFVRPEWFVHLRELNRLALRGNRISEIPTNTFARSHNLHYLDLDKNELKYLSSGAFVGLDGLKVLRLSNNNITRIDTGALSLLTALEELYLDGNKIDTLVEGTFSGLANLRSLSIAHNLLVELRKEVVSPLTNLQQLDISHNSIKIVRKNNFFGLLRMRELKLNHNEIRVIEDEAFAVTVVNTKSQLTWLYLNDNAVSRVGAYTLYGVPYLKFCSLGNNQIDSIDEGGLSKLKRLYTLILNNNSISQLDVTVFKHLSHLQQLSLAGNRMRSLPVGVFTGLERVEDIDLSGNEIELVPARTFSHTPRLLSLNLRHNRLRSTDLGIIDVTRHIKYINLSGNMIDRVTMPSTVRRTLFFLSLADNSLRTLSHNVTHMLSFGGALHLYGNPWSCDCNIRWMLSATGRRGLQLASSSSIVCKEPPAFSGSKLLSLQHTDFRCYGRRSHSNRYYSDQLLSTTRRVPLACRISRHSKVSRDHYKSDKHDVTAWQTIFSTPHSHTSCIGVRLDRKWVLTRSGCWKELGVDSKVFVEIGREPDRYEAIVHEVWRYSGPLDLALVQISLSSVNIKAQDFPCLLSNDSYGDIVGGVGRAVVGSAEVAGKSARTVRVVDVEMELVDDRGAGQMSLCATGQGLVSRGSMEAVVFVKVDQSRWALAGVNGKRDRISGVVFNPVYPAIEWIEEMLQ